MDNVHNIDKKPWISRDKYNIKKLSLKYGPLLKSNNISLRRTPPNDQDSSHNSELTSRLEQFVLETADEIKPYFLFNSGDERCLIQDPECDLAMYKLQLEHAKRMISDRVYKVNYLTRLKTTRKELLMRQLASHNRPVITPCNPDESQQIDTCDIATVVVVQIWPQPKKNEKIKLEKEILFRSDQCLTDLRDQFRCQRDYGVPMDLSDNPEQLEDRVFQCELFKSSLFLIEDTFYNDMRDPNNTDLSANINNWASEDVTVIDNDGDYTKVTRGIGPFTRVSMDQNNSVKFEDLTFRLGYPYLYLHQGDCEHLFTFSDIRYIPRDAQFEQTKFPCVTATAIGHKRDSLKCFMCRNRPPHWYTRNNNRLPVDPYFFCENCFNTFNYDKDKKKIGQFQAYPYTGAFGVPDSIVRSVNKPD